MKVRKFINGITALAVAVGMGLSLTACGTSSYEDKLIGNWSYSKDDSTVSTDATKIRLFEGGSATNSGEDGTWELNGSTLSIKGSYGGQFFRHDTIIGEIKIKDDKLIITNPSVDGHSEGGELVYIKRD